MTGYLVRPFGGDVDIDAVVDLRLAVESHRPSGFSASRTRLRDAYLRSRAGWARSTSLWERNDRLLGLGDLRTHDGATESQIAYLRFHVHPDEARSELDGEIVSWAEAKARERFGSGFQIECSADRGSDDRIALLLSRGYAVDRVFHLMRLSIEEARPFTQPVPGYRIRPFRLTRDTDAWLTLYEGSFQDHYDFHPIARENRVQSLDDEAYLPELDLVVESDAGELAAFCITVRRVDDAGEVDWHTDLIGTDRAHRRRGLAEWLLRQTVARVQDRGGRELSLEVDATSPTGANRLYERLGFAVTRELVDYRKSFD